MIRKIFTFMFVLSFAFSVAAPIFHAQKPEDYEKYGRIATVVVKEDYPQEKLVEYQYVGREKAGENQVTDTFRYEVLKDGKPIFVHVKVTHSLKDNKQLTLTLEEQEQ